MQRCLGWLLLGTLAACGDDQAGEARDLDASVRIACTNDPDASTALGVRGVELWAAYEGTYTLPSARFFSRGSYVDTATFTVTVARSLSPAPGLDDCSEVAVPVLVTVQSADPVVNESIVGVLRGSLFAADVAFATPEYLLGFEPRFYGSLLFQRGQAIQLRLRVDAKGTWTAPPPQETP